MDGGLAFILDEDRAAASTGGSAGAPNDDSELLDSYSRAVIGAADKVAPAVVHVRVFKDPAPRGPSPGGSTMRSYAH